MPDALCQLRVGEIDLFDDICFSIWAIALQYLSSLQEGRQGVLLSEERWSLCTVAWRWLQLL
ncbi:hypothetical protein AO265_26365 [Pseudomonas sp. ABAC61]|nr:hypothetical protein AO265_26365 [Pseudomonas sp. ABAC61]